MFLGQHTNTIDEKGRITLPSRFRELLSDGAYITVGLDQNLIVMPASHFIQQYERINSMNPNNPLVRNYRRFTFGRAAKIEFDSVGRFIIPQNLRESASLTNSAVIVGIGEDIEIWSPDLWAKQAEKLENPETSTSGFENLDLSNS
jgi:MraZ protein